MMKLSILTYIPCCLKGETNNLWVVVIIQIMEWNWIELDWVGLNWIWLDQRIQKDNKIEFQKKRIVVVELSFLFKESTSPHFILDSQVERDPTKRAIVLSQKYCCDLSFSLSLSLTLSLSLSLSLCIYIYIYIYMYI